MIVVNGIIQSTLEDIQAMTHIVATMEQASRAEEGCEDYTFSVELSDPTVIRITERWVSLEALQAHFTMPHMAEFQQALGAHPPKSIDVKFYEASEIDVGL